MSTANPPKKKRKTKKKRSSRLSSATILAALDSSDEGSHSAFEEWADYLSQRKRPVRLGKLAAKSGNPLTWGVPDHLLRETQAFRDFKRPNGKKKKKKSKSKPSKRTFPLDSNFATGWLDQVESGDTSSAYFLDTLFLCHELPRSADQLPLNLWKELLDQLIALSRECAFGGPAENAWTAQMAIVELPITLSYLFPELKHCSPLARDGTERLSSSLNGLLDGQGFPMAGDLELMYPLAATWTRCLTMLREIPGLKVDSQAKLRYEWLLRNVLRLTNSQGTRPFSEETVDPVGLQQMLKAGTKLTGDVQDSALSKLVLHQKPIPDAKLPPDPGYHSEWSGIAVLTPDWEPDSPRLIVNFSELTLKVELRVQNTTIFSTPWDADVLIDGKRLRPNESSWESVCWFSDFDVDYLELQLGLTDGWTIQRQFLMARQDLFLYTADVLLGPEDANCKIDYSIPLPCGPSLRLDPQDDSREGSIYGKRRLSLVFPPALPEWRSDPRYGELRMRDGAIELSQKHQGRALVAPLFFDFHRRRMRKQMTWRQLTVAESLNIQSRDQAIGYRVQVGPEQWLFYRSLQKGSCRTVLGQNLTCEFLCARFLDDGDVDHIIQVE